MTTTTFDRTSRRAAVPDPVPSPSGAELWHQASGRGVDTRFGPPRGAHLPLYECLPAFPLRHPLAGHEQGAARMADGYARSSGKVGVCNATSGPGALNLITGLATAHFDSIPVVAVTGQVAATTIRTDAFQESDAIGSSLSLIKHSYQVLDASEIPAVVGEAFHVASSGRPGRCSSTCPRTFSSSAWLSSGPRSSAARPTVPLAHRTDSFWRECLLSGRDPIAMALG
ncbi:MAG: thiamine pyrophosphate-binding protein [Candidatus Dormibacteria bacterium]